MNFPQQIATAVDEFGRPMVFSTNTSHGISLYRRNRAGLQVGQIELSDFNTDLQGPVVTAIALYQYLDKTIHLASICVSLVDDQPSMKVQILAPFTPDRIPQSSATKFVLPSQTSFSISDNIPRPTSIDVVPSAGQSSPSFADVYVSHGTNAVTQMVFASFTFESRQIDLQVPRLAMCRAYIGPYCLGYYFLEADKNDHTRVILRLVSDDGAINKRIKIQEGLNQICGILNSRLTTDVILAGRNLYYLAMSDALKARPPPLQLLSEDPVFTSLTRMKVGQTGTGDTAVFVISGANRVTHKYVVVKESLTNEEEPNVVIPEGQVSDFSAIDSQNVVVKDALYDLQLYGIDPSSETWLAGQVLWS